MTQRAESGYSGFFTTKQSSLVVTTVTHRLLEVPVNELQFHMDTVLVLVLKPRFKSVQSKAGGPTVTDIYTRSVCWQESVDTIPVTIQW